MKEKLGWSGKHGKSITGDIAIDKNKVFFGKILGKSSYLILKSSLFGKGNLGAPGRELKEDKTGENKREREECAIAGPFQEGRGSSFREKECYSDDGRKKKRRKEREEITTKHPGIIGGDTGLEEIDKCRECYANRNEDEPLLFSQEEQDVEQSETKKNEGSIKEKDRAESKGVPSEGRCVHGFLGKAMEKLQKCFAYHFVIRQIEEKITQEKKSEKDTGERDTFPGVGTKE